MAQVTINRKKLNKTLSKLDQLLNPLTKRGATQLGSIIVAEMKKDISRLKSPIRGKGRFPGLTEKYRKQKRSGNIPGQINTRPAPDLFLTGKFLNSLISVANKVKGDWSTTIKFSNRKSQLKEKGHRDSRNSRPIIPSADEGFNRRISGIIFAFMNSTISGIIRRR